MDEFDKPGAWIKAFFKAAWVASSNFGAQR